jgi:hypothetical protein
MARYRVGNRYLSEREYAEDQNGKAGLLVVIVAGTVLMFCGYGLADPEWPKAARFVVQFVLPWLLALPLALLGRFVRRVLYVAVPLGLIGLLFYLLYQNF